MTVRFDESLGTIVELIHRELGSDATNDAVFIRDATGLLSVVINGEIEEEKLGDLQRLVSEALGAYARWEDVVRDRNGPGAARILAAVPVASRLRVAGHSVAFVDRRMVGADWLLAPAPAAEVTRFAFASLKGGVGRSTALAVLAAHLSFRGLRVLAIDLDLEAPGIGTMLLGPSALPKYGTLDYLLENGISGIVDAFVRTLAGKSFLGSSGGQVTVLPAIGTATLDNPSDTLSKIARAYLEDVKAGGGTVPLTDQIREMVERFESTGDYDVVLIDGRAGLHETTAAVLLGLGAEILFFGVDEPQTYLGYKLLLSHFTRFHDKSYDEWWRRIQFVHAKSSTDDKKKKDAAGRFAELVALVRREADVGDDARDGREVLTADDFEMEWTDEEEGTAIDDILTEEVNIIRILDDARYRDFDPLRDQALLTSSLFEVTFGELIAWIEAMIPILRTNDDAS